MKKLISLFLALMLLMSLSSMAVAQSTEITWWTFPVFGQENANDPAGTYEQKLAAAFMAKNPGITVKVETIDFQSGPEKLVSAIEGGKAPDVLFDAPGRIIEYGRNGKLVKLDDMFTDEFKADVNNDALLGACSDGTNYWMYP
ncbi:MAG: extracellular solute-binding protein, partial [Leucobacter sp.]|nr:extracellular solute-binding protein [Leucobacter sp.]